ncbi:Ger(x)C family spore germination protein [Cohnella panacarvi]|uniref:Ger(x)C family spore germination protein n=1 Tax=Cohnella panacarvi TaxID=400776 RepID=UPI00047EEFC9|nr:Ger(x)C family spore germination protein [Cohnella panacarvi]
MRRFGMSILSICLLPFLLTGCWDLKDLQEINYLTAIGFDLEGGDFMVYGQMLDFTTVAKTEGSKPGATPVWVGKGRGKTLVQAIDDLYRTSQLRIFYGHINAIVISAKVLKDSFLMEQIEQFFSRFYELRFTPWIFGTSESIDEVFSATSIFDLSPEISILHQPMESYKQRSIFTPLSVRTYALETNEPNRSVMLPSISFSKRKWTKSNKPEKLLAINGAYAMEGEKFQGWFPSESMLGLTWVDPNSYRGPLVLYDGKELLAGITVEKPKVTIRPRVRGDKAEYAIKVAMTGTINILMVQLPEAELEREAANVIRDQIRELYNEGLKHDTDILNLTTSLYRKKNREWKKLRSSGGLKLTSESLAAIDVSVKLRRSGNMKMQLRIK